MTLGREKLPDNDNPELINNLNTTQLDRDEYHHSQGLLLKDKDVQIIEILLVYRNNKSY